MPHWAIFILGVFSGVFIGWFALALCYVAREADRVANKPGSLEADETYCRTVKALMEGKGGY